MNLEATQLFVDISEVLEYIHREKVRKNTICLVYQKKNTKTMVHSSGGDKNFFDFVTGVLQHICLYTAKITCIKLP